MKKNPVDEAALEAKNSESAPPERLLVQSKVFEPHALADVNGRSDRYRSGSPPLDGTIEMSRFEQPVTVVLSRSKKK